jgi:hypothetical protein
MTRFGESRTHTLYPPISLQLKIPLPDDYDCAANTSSTSEKKKRKSKSGKVKRTGKETPEHEQSRSAQYNGDGESLTTAVTAAAADPDTWATKTEFAPVEVTNADSVDFLSNFDVDYLARKQAVTGTCTSPLRPIVKNKQCLDFLSKFDKSYSAVKAETEKHAVTKTSKTSLSGSARLSVTDSSILLARGAMQTYEGKLQAEDRAFGAIQRILTSDFEVVADDDVLETRNVGENELERDVEMYAL